MTTPTNPLAGRRFVDEHGNPVVPGEKLGEGGEGVVHLVNGDPGSVVKIWHPGKAPQDAYAKIRHLVNNPVLSPDLGATWHITWPQRMVMENGTIAGYTMPILNQAENWEPIVEYYNRRAAQGTGAAQAREIQIDDRVRMARNLALGFMAVHEAGYVIGDVNEKNVEVNRQNDIAMVDCDSYGFTDTATGRNFSNNMGRPEFQAPEAQGDYANRTQEQDLFGLAVVIFHLLTGYHPYTVNNQPDYSLPGERIGAWLFAPAGRGVTAPDPYNEVWETLTDKQKELFLRVFDKSREGEPRPKPEEWVEALREMPTVPVPASSPTPGPSPAPTSPGPGPSPTPASPPGPRPAPGPRRYYTPPGSLPSSWPLWLSAVAGYSALILLTTFSEFRPWWWLSLTLVAGLLLYFPARRLLQPPITYLRWAIIATASFVGILVLLALAQAALSTWPWWMWLGAASVAALVFAVPARGAFSSPNVRRRYAVMGAVALVAVFILAGMGAAAFRGWQDWSLERQLQASSGASGGSELSGSGGGTAGNGASGSGGASSGNEPGAGTGASGPSIPAPAIPGGETSPTVTLELSSSSISENGGSSTVTASLSSPSSATITLTVSIAPGPGADSADYTLSKAALTIEAGSTTSADSLTVSAIDNDTDAPDKTVSIYGGASNELGAIDPAAVTLTIADDDAAPAVTLELDSFSISENGGAANVTASLSGPSSQDVTVVVSASPESPAADGDFNITSNNALTIAAGSTVSAGTVTITAIDNSVDEPDKSVTVSATVSGGRGVDAPSARTLTIADDDGTPTVTLSLSSSSISEDGGVSMVTATLSAPSSQPVTVEISASPVSPAVSSDFTITSNSSLTIEAGSTQSTDSVTITGVDNNLDEPHKSVIVSAAVRGRGVSAPSSLALAITDDDGAPAVALDLNPSSISENGGVAIVTATLSPPSSQPVTVEISASPVSPTADGDFTISSGTSLSIAAGSTGTAGTVTITGVDNSVDGPDKSVTVSATVTGRDVTAPSSRTLTITDDEAAPTVTLELSAPSISENGGAASVAASLNGPSSQDVIIAVSASPTSHAVSDDFTITSNNTLTIEAGSTHSTGTVTITGVDNSVDEPDKSVTVSANATGRDVTDPSSLTLAITDDEATPVTLELSSYSISENGGAANITAYLGVPSSQDVTVVVSASPVSPAVEGDFTITSNNTLTIAAGSTHSTDVVTITGVDDSVDGPDKSVTVSATVSGRDLTAPSSQALTITDDDDAPGVTLVLSSYSISENGGATNVTASLSGPSSQDVTLVVAASPEPPAAVDDFTITRNNTLTIAAGSTHSTGVVTITAVDNSMDGPDKSVTVSATVGDGHDVGAPSSHSLAITDDDATPTLTFELSSYSISENGGVANVTASLSGPSSQDVTVTVSVSPISPAVNGDFTISSDATLTIAAGSTHSTGVVTITGVDNRADAPHKSVTVSATVSGGHELSDPSSRVLTIRDDDDAPTVTLVLSPSSISENGGVAHVTASLSNPSSQDVILEVSASPNPPAVSGDFTITSNKTLTIEAGSTDSTGTVTITGVDNSADEPDKSVLVWATVSDSRGVSARPLRLLFITDDESA